MGGPGRTALLIIDMQVGLLDGAFEELRVIETVGNLLDEARAARLPVVHVQHDHLRYEPLMPGRATWRIHPRLAPVEGEPVVHKSASDAFYRTNLQSVLEAAGVDRLIVAGMQTEFCVDTTVRAASSRGFDVILVSDGHTTGDAALPADRIIEHHNQTLANLAQSDHPVRVLSYADLQAEWLATAR